MVTLVVLGIVMIPVGAMSLEYMRGIVYSRELGVAEALAKIEVSKINNLAYDDPTLADGYDHTFTSYEGYAYDVRRTVSYVDQGLWGTNLKKVRVRVYPSNDSNNALANFITYIADVSFGAGSGP
jgi:hypothetical protein